MARLLIVLLGLFAALAGCRDKGSTPVAPEPSALAGRACGSPDEAGSQSCAPAPSTKPPHSDPQMARFCKESCETRSAYQASDVVPVTQAAVGDLTRCPVSGVVFRVTGETPKVEYSGRQHWVCCSGCLEKFQENPGRFSGS